MNEFDSDVMDDLYDAAEGPARQAYDDFDGFDDSDGFDEGDEGDEFLGRLLSGVGQAVGGLLGGNQADEFDDGDGFEEGDDFDADSFEDAVADALDAADGDEFFRRIRRLAQRVGRGIGSAARVIGPIASMIPIPQAQLIGRIANVAGRLMADGADEFEAFDALIDEFDEDAIDAAAPVIAGLAVRRALPQARRLPRQQRRRIVRSATQATRALVRRHRAPAARVVPRIISTVSRAVSQRRLPIRAVPAAVRRVAQQVVRQPAQVRRLARPLTTAATRTGVRPARQAVHSCPNCGRGRHMRIRGPVTIHIGR